MYKTKPHRAVSYSESAIMKVAENAGSLIAEVKYDGLRGNLIIGDPNYGDYPEFLTRESTSVPALQYLFGDSFLSEQWAALLEDDENPFKTGVMVDGELLVKGVSFQAGSGLLRTKYLKDTNSTYHYDSAPQVNTKTGKLVRGQLFGLGLEHLTMVVYDLVPLRDIKEGTDYQVPTVIRVEHAKLFVKLLKRHIPQIYWQSPESWDVFDLESLHELYNEQRKAGHEGLVVKDPFSPYKRGKKTGMWKMKPENEADGVIVGLLWGTPGKTNEGLVIGFEVLLESGVVVNATGITRSQMIEFTHKVQHNRCLETAYDGKPGEYYHGWQCQVAYMEKTPDGSLRHPSFHSFRGTEEDPTLKV